jgi:uncharacterized Zn-finger protein
MKPFEVVQTSETLVSCDGDDLGHPRIFLNLVPSGEAQCPYCSRLFANPAANVPGAGESGYSSVATPSAHGPGASKDEDRPPPRQS